MATDYAMRYKSIVTNQVSLVTNHVLPPATTLPIENFHHLRKPTKVYKSTRPPDLASTLPPHTILPRTLPNTSVHVPSTELQTRTPRARTIIVFVIALVGFMKPPALLLCCERYLTLTRARTGRLAAGLSGASTVSLNSAPATAA